MYCILTTECVDMVLALRPSAVGSRRREGYLKQTVSNLGTE